MRITFLMLLALCLAAGETARAQTQPQSQPPAADASALPPANPWAPAEEIARNSYVRLAMMRGDGGYYYATGVIVQADLLASHLREGEILVLTAGHCGTPASQAQSLIGEFVWEDGVASAYLRIIAYRDDVYRCDVAFFAMTGLSSERYRALAARAVPLGPDELTSSNYVLYGSPYGRRLQKRFVRFSHWVTYQGGYPMIHSADIGGYGDSGAGLFDADGTLVAIHSGWIWQDYIASDGRKYISDAYSIETTAAAVRAYAAWVAANIAPPP